MCWLYYNLSISLFIFSFFHSLFRNLEFSSLQLNLSLRVFLFFPDMSVITTGGYVSRQTSSFVFSSSNFFPPFLWFIFYLLFVFQILALIHSTVLLLFYFFLICIIHVVLGDFFYVFPKKKFCVFPVNVKWFFYHWNLTLILN